MGDVVRGRAAAVPWIDPPKIDLSFITYKKDKYIIIGGDFNIESKYSKNIIKSMKVFNSKNPTIYIKYDKSNNELYSTSEEEEGLTSYNLN